MYEKLPSFYVSNVHERNRSVDALAKFRQLAGNVRQQEGRLAFNVMKPEDKRYLARCLAELCQPPPYVSG